MLLQRLVSPISIDDFNQNYFRRQPYAAPSRGQSLDGLIDWRLLREIFLEAHPDCWLAENGRLPNDPQLTKGFLNMAEARLGFSEGRTIVVRHSETAHPRLRPIADEFQQLYQAPTDIQLYVTPAGHEGFDWHFDREEVFVVQSTGEKEFRLRRTVDSVETRCLLQAGDFLYIPSGYWHKARAVTDSFHLSIGVMMPEVTTDALPSS